MARTKLEGERFTIEESNAIKTAEWTARIDAEESKDTSKLTPMARKAQAERIAKSRYYLSNINDSTFGRLEELWSCTDNSTKIRVSAQGKADTYIKWRDNAHGRRAVEVKTNGGRIGGLIDRMNKGAKDLIVYDLNICNSTTQNLPRRLEQPVIVPFDLFYAMLVECNAIKRTNGSQDEYAIQPSNKKMFDRLCDYPITYDPNYVYSNDEFEGIEI